MTESTSVLFSNPNIGLVDVFKHVSKLFRAKWKLYLHLAVANQIYQLLLSIIVFGSIFLFIIPSEVSHTLFSHVFGEDDAINTWGNWHSLFVNHVTGAGGATSRLLQTSHDWNNFPTTQKYYDLDYYSDFSDIAGKIINSIAEMSEGALIGLFLTTITFVIGMLMVSCTFQGAIIRVASETFVGSSSPITFGQAQRHGVAAMHKMLGFKCLYGLGLVFITVIPIMIGAIVSQDLTVVIFLGLIILMAIIIINSILYSTQPSIIIEKQPVFYSIRRSCGLCKNKICFIFSCVIILTLLERIVIVATGDLGIVMAVIMSPFHDIMSTILYIIFRIESEGVTRVTLAKELSVDHPNTESYMPVNLMDEEEAV